VSGLKTTDAKPFVFYETEVFAVARQMAGFAEFFNPAGYGLLRLANLFGYLFLSEAGKPISEDSKE
jgi:hypothetical protein